MDSLQPAPRRTSNVVYLWPAQAQQREQDRAKHQERTIAVARELLDQATRGCLHGLIFCVDFDGESLAGACGSYAADLPKAAAAVSALYDRVSLRGRQAALRAGPNSARQGKQREASHG